MKWDGTPPSPPSSHALRFEKSSTVTIPDFGILFNDPATLEAYVKPEAAKGSVMTKVGRGFELGINEAGLWEFSRGKLAVKTSEKAELNMRVHIAGVYTGSELQIYLDGKLAGRNSKLGGAIPAKKTDISLGDEGIVGAIDEIRVSKSARYDQDFTPAARLASDQDTVALYHLDEGQGDILTDSSGNGHHGKIIGAKWVKADGAAVSAQLLVNEKYALAITDNMVKELAGQPNLVWLDLNGAFTEVTDAVVEHLVGLKNLN